MKLTKHFSLSEFTRSTIAGIRGIDNVPSNEVIVNLHILCRKVLEPLRELLGTPIIVSSGYRNEELNRLVGGVPSSQHVLGQAADIFSNELTPR